MFVCQTGVFKMVNLWHPEDVSQQTQNFCIALQCCYEDCISKWEANVFCKKKNIDVTSNKLFKMSIEQHQIYFEQ